MTDKFAALREAESKRTPQGQLRFDEGMLFVDTALRRVDLRGYFEACTHPTHGVVALLDAHDDACEERDQLRQLTNEMGEEQRCPGCGCATPDEAEAGECGCGDPVCAIERPHTLATAYDAACRERDRLREALKRWQVAYGEPFMDDSDCALAWWYGKRVLTRTETLIPKEDRE